MHQYRENDWIKIEDEDDYFQIKSIDLDSGYVRVQGLTGHPWTTGINTIERVITQDELYAFSNEI
jgi:hypothetical protein|tara:strand:+ start:1217 stop:1411 length:195 start_codon:yes stop_codon:yes gene_type:complete